MSNPCLPWLDGDGVLVQGQIVGESAVDVVLVAEFGRNDAAEERNEARTDDAVDQLGVALELARDVIFPVRDLGEGDKKLSRTLLVAIWRQTFLQPLPDHRNELEAGIEGAEEARSGVADNVQSVFASVSHAQAAEQTRTQDRTRRASVHFRRIRHQTRTVLHQA